MKWYKPLYFSDSLQSVLKQRRVLHKLAHNIFQNDIFVIALCENGKDIFRIIPSNELLQKGYPKQDLPIVGIAKGKEEALLLVEQMVTEVYQKHGDLRTIKEYFKSGRRRK